MRLIKISVIVPIYNAEKYLHRCIDSILSQSFKDFEVLLIDDGSTDNSGKICNNYAAKDARIRVFHKKNGGVSTARELGVQQAKGEYSIHVDADDWIECHMLEKMYRKAKQEQLDMLIADFYHDDKGKSIYIKQSGLSTYPDSVLKDILQNKLFGSLWHKLIRHNLYKEKNIHFIENINYCEDVLVLVQLLQQPIKIGFLNEAFYHYNSSNSNSITRNYKLDTYYMRKQYVTILMELLPMTYEPFIMQVATLVKKEAFTHKILPKNEFYNFMPLTIAEIKNNKNLGRKCKMCYILAYLGLYKLSMELSSLIRA